MRRFVPEVCAFVAIQLALIVAVWALCGRAENHYMAATKDKHARLETATGRRLVVVGSSAAAFGINSERLGQELGLAPVNMGLLGTLGLEFMLAEVEPALRAGDVVLVMPSYEEWRGDAKDARLVTLFEVNPALLRHANAEQLKVVLDDGLRVIARRARCALSAPQEKAAGGEGMGGYRRSGFNAVGDYVGHAGRGSTLPAGLEDDWPTVQLLGRDRVSEPLASFARRSEARGIRVLMSFAPIVDHTAAANRPVLEELVRRAELLGVPIVNRPEDVMFSKGQFYDTFAHLTHEAAQEHTQRLLARLTVLLGQGQP